ncbi:hypothetical protein ABIQ69_11440 [Agromyces sp. G08B096]|uniref:Uncharacterized protein n=1 Tax=Agromyces sp. G08B096 TaxID=3156399 RepID=A0AAU7W4X3_9MICO
MTETPEEIAQKVVDAAMEESDPFIRELLLALRTARFRIEGASMNVGKDSKVRLLSSGGEVEYSVQATVSLAHFIDMLRRLESLDVKPDPESHDSRSER